MLRKVLETIKENNMIKAGDKVVCALSGGADSLALLYALYEIKDELSFSLYAAHLNHSVRGADADYDNLYVKEVCESLGVEFFEKKVNVPYLSKMRGESEEKCGRDERYAFFDEVCEKLGGGLIATGHHMNDNAETVLFNLFRGSGMRGLRGIPCKRGNIIRPLIGVAREETEAFLINKGVKWCEDYTNGECEYTRNNIRLVILKEVRKIFPGAVKKINDAAKIIAIDDDCLNILAKESHALENGVIDGKVFSSLHQSLRRRVAINAMEEWGVVLIDNEKIKAVCDICAGATGREYDLGNNIIIVNEYAAIRKRSREEEKEKPIPVKMGESLEIKGFEGTWSIKTVDKCEKIRDNKMMAIFDADKIGGEIFVRCREDGDYIYPEKMQGKKKIKKIFIDLKIPKEIRDKMQLLTVGNEVLFIPGIRKSGNYKADENTKRYFVAQYHLHKEEKYK